VARGGKRIGAGRKLGSATKRTREIAEAASSSGLMPSEFQLSIMRDETQELSVRMAAARDAAPYVHPRLAAVEHTGPGGGPIQVNISGDDAGLL
jgi:hypothetical protein